MVKRPFKDVRPVGPIVNFGNSDISKEEQRRQQQIRQRVQHKQEHLEQKQPNSPEQSEPEPLEENQPEHVEQDPSGNQNAQEPAEQEEINPVLEQAEKWYNAVAKEENKYKMMRNYLLAITTLDESEVEQMLEEAGLAKFSRN